LRGTLGSSFLGLRYRDRQRHGATFPIRDLHRFKRQWRHLHGFAIDFHDQKVIFGCPRTDPGLLHLGLEITCAKFAAGSTDDEADAAGAVVRFANLKIMFVSVERHLHAGCGKKLYQMLELPQAGTVQRSGSEGRMVEKRDHPQRMRLRKFCLHPMELRAVLEISRA
jgi:hypothetical protein